MIRTVARLIAPARAETPIASPSAKLWTPIAAAIVSPVRSAARRAASRSRAALSGRMVAAATAPPPPAIGGRRAPSGRIRRWSIARPALPAPKPTPSNITSQTTYASDTWPFLNPCTATWTIDRPFESTSTKMNASTPTANIASATRARLLRICIRPTGKPR